VGRPLSGILGEVSEGLLAMRFESATAGLEGPQFVEAVRVFAERLDDEERAELGRLLLARARQQGSFDYGLIRRIQEPYLQLFRPRPIEPGYEPPRFRRRRRP
jgi:hypothetical protein